MNICHRKIGCKLIWCWGGVAFKKLIQKKRKTKKQKEVQDVYAWLGLENVYNQIIKFNMVIIDKVLSDAGGFR